MKNYQYFKLIFYFKNYLSKTLNLYYFLFILKYSEMNFKFSFKNQINECNIIDDDNNDINGFRNIFIFSKF
jgi:hypothetical protein